MSNEQPKGERYYKVFHCHGCQSCWEVQEDDTVIKYPHVLSSEDVTAEVLAALENSKEQK